MSAQRARFAGRYWICDEEDTPQCLPLRTLVARIGAIACASGAPVFVRRSQGYGLAVNRLDDALDDADEVTVSYEELEGLSVGTEEWFYDLEARCATAMGSVVFGVHDSTALFVEGPSPLVERIVVVFGDVRADDSCRR